MQLHHVFQLMQPLLAFLNGLLSQLVFALQLLLKLFVVAHQCLALQLIDFAVNVLDDTMESLFEILAAG